MLIRCVMVGVPNEATPTHIRRRSGSAGFRLIYAALHTHGKSARCGRGSTYTSATPAALGLIGQRIRPSWPNAQVCTGGPLGLAKPYPLTDAAQLLDSNAAPGAFSLGHDAFT